MTFYRVIVNLSTMTAVVPYVFCALAGVVIARGRSARGAGTEVGVVEVVAFSFSMFTLWGCGTEAVLYGFLLLMLGIPVYVWQTRERGSLTDEPTRERNDDVTSAFTRRSASCGR